MAIEKYVPIEEFQGLVEDRIIDTNYLKNRLKSRGILVFCANAQDLSILASKYIWGCDFITKIHESVNKEKSKLKSTVTILKAEDKQENFFEELSDVFSREARIPNSRYEITNLVKKDNSLTMQYAFKKKQKGKTQFIDEKNVVIDVVVSELKNNEYKVNIQHDSAGDSKKVIDLLNELQNNANEEVEKDSKLYSLQRITLSSLLPKNKVKLFYEFANYKYSNWRIENINNVNIDRYENEDADDCEIETSISGGELLEGINSVILKGTNLNQNNIVKECEKKGFIFKSMCFRISNINNATAFDLEISFKQRDLKVNVIRSYTIDENENTEPAWIDKENQYKYINYFQDVVYEIYSKLLDEQKKEFENK